ncbi:glycerol-3-phosphate 1-O-acyltransferase PlsY [Spiroplasma culicicola]|uniref:Glycerol-3-phosphate acyltransferase n=1 Tax=Spiroplasma culicicola AES-1 TaxID=1276246 RepID=W6AGS3_9MOLU|nr:glycerol-3-phosphate 1-O-acyltransferase PlsY [Spiroplasma culicicola]AHI52889.1 glycerol-3-phosphate acyltransferase PlsY [Spiroplasma culicicola AES-1]
MYVGTILASVIGYLLGSFSFSITVVKLKTKQDVRTLGSKNAGATNASRVLGKQWGILIMLLDSLKIFITAFIAIGFAMIPNDLFDKTSYIIPAFFTLLGHCYPVYYKFKGGKAVSCFLGLMAIVNWIIFLVFLGTWLILLMIFKRVSVASIFAALLAGILMWIPQISGGSQFIIDGTAFFTPIYDQGKTFVWFNSFHAWNGNSFYESFLTINIVVTLAMFLLIARHRENVKRILTGTEPAFFGTKKKSENKTAKKDENK